MVLVVVTEEKEAEESVLVLGCSNSSISSISIVVSVVVMHTMLINCHGPYIANK